VRVKTFKRSAAVRDLVKARLRTSFSFAIRPTVQDLASMRGPAAALYREITKSNAPKVVLAALRRCLSPEDKRGNRTLRCPPISTQSCTTANLGNLVILATTAVVLSPSASPHWVAHKRGRLIKIFSPAGYTYIAVHLRKNQQSGEPVVVFRHMPADADGPQ
jgi:hypothetical protein